MYIVLRVAERPGGLRALGDAAEWTGWTSLGAGGAQSVRETLRAAAHARLLAPRRLGPSVHRHAAHGVC